MRKSIIIVLAVAIIGGLGIYDKSHHSAQLVSRNSNQAVQSDSTAATDSSADSSNSSASSNGSFKDGTYTGNGEDTAYGTVQVSVVISGGSIIQVNFLQAPNDLQHSQEVTAFAEPLLKQETLQKQSAQIDFVSGATSTSAGYQQSLQSALDQAA